MALNPQAREKVWLPVRNANCTLCPLHKEANTVCLLGDGPVPSKVMIIGEAPGAREDDVERPFSGVAGRYLDRILSEVGIPRESVYITNSVRCRPPENRTPTKTELKACAGYMQSELEIVNPSHVLLLGNSALQGLTGKTGIMKRHGVTSIIGGRTFMGTVHPAAVLRYPAHEVIFRGDLVSFAAMVRGEERRPETKTGLIQSSKGLAKLCSLLAAVDGPIAFDVETSTKDRQRDKGGLQPWAPDGVIDTVAFSWERGRSYVVALEHPHVKWDIPIERVYEALNVALAGKRMVGHNVKFDAQWMRVKGVNLYSHFDTKLAAHLLDENRPSGLKPLARTYLNAGEWEAGISFTGITPLPRLAIYNGKDADYTLRLYTLFKEELKKRPRLLRLYMKLTMPAVRAFTEIEMNGFPVDIVKLRERHKDIKEKITEVNDKLIRYIPKKRRESLQLDPLQKGYAFRSPIFLGWFFFEYLKLPILIHSPKTHRPSTAEKVLLRLKRKHESVGLLMELRKWHKYESTYTRNWLTRVGVARKPRLYTSYNLSGTVTGRLSSNMQQVPREVYIRSILGFPASRGRKFIEADFSQIELRIATMFSGDATLTRAFKTGGDPHMETAEKILKKPRSEISKEERKLAKSVNFGFLYGMGWKKFISYAFEKYDMDVSEDEAKAYRKAFFDQYSALSSWHERQRRIVRNAQQVHSPTGRTRHLSIIDSTDEEIQAMAEREAINSPVQGFASDLTVLAMVLLHDRLGDRGRILGNVHDSIILEAKDENAEEVGKIVKETMENLPLKKLFGYRPTVPIQADVSISNHWGEK